MKNISAQEWLEQCLNIVDDIYPCSLTQIEQAEEKLGFHFREDHKQFLLRFGGRNLGQQRTQFLSNTGADYDLDVLLDYYKENKVSGIDELPSGMIYFGSSFFSTDIAIHQLSGNIQTFDSNEVINFYADSVEKFLVQSLVHYYLFCTVSNKVSYSGINAKSHREILNLLVSNDFTVQTDLTDQRKIIATNHEVNFYCDFNPDSYHSESSRRGGIFTISGLPDQKRKTEKYATYFAKAFKLKNRI